MFKFNDGSQRLTSPGATAEILDLGEELNSRMNLETGDTFSNTEAINELQRMRGFRLNASEAFNKMLHLNIIMEV